MNKSVLITDLDNTLFDWFDVWYRCFDAMLNKVTEISGVPREVLVKEIRPVHQKHGSSEYAFLLESLPSMQRLYGDRESINSALDEAIHAYRSMRKKHLCLYPTVMDALLEIRKRKTCIVAFTESKAFYSRLRIKRLNLDGVIDVLFSPEDHDVPIEDKQRTLIHLEKTIQMHTPANELKPNPKLLLDIIHALGAQIEDCVYIGDSEMKDVQMAQNAGVTDVFASYGNDHFEMNEDRYNLLRAVTHWSDEDVKREKRIKEQKILLKPSFSVRKFSELLILFTFTAFEGNYEC